jgi:hypothetical protein
MKIPKVYVCEKTERIFPFYRPKTCLHCLYLNSYTDLNTVKRERPSYLIESRAEFECKERRNLNIRI